MSNTTSHGGLTIATELYNFVNEDLLRGAPINARAFWDGFDTAVHRLAPKNAELLARRSQFQKQIDSWLKNNASGGIGFQPMVPASALAPRAMEPLQEAIRILDIADTPGIENDVENLAWAYTRA